MKFKHIKMVNWKMIVMISCLIAAVMIAGSSVLAYMADADYARNVLEIGENTIELVEEFDPPKELEPGVTFTKNVKVSNTGSIDCFVRIKAVFTDSDMGKYCDVDWNEEDWVYSNEDGYWYYTKVVAAGQSSTSLFTTIQLSENIDPALIKDFDIIVYAESYQSYGFSNYNDAWAHYQTNKPE